MWAYPLLTLSLYSHRFFDSPRGSLQKKFIFAFYFFARDSWKSDQTQNLRSLEFNLTFTSFTFDFCGCVAQYFLRQDASTLTDDQGDQKGQEDQEDQEGQEGQDQEDQGRGPSSLGSFRQLRFLERCCTAREVHSDCENRVSTFKDFNDFMDFRFESIANLRFFVAFPLSSKILRNYILL